jgi:type II secretory pathway pseudopilin PulG
MQKSIGFTLAELLICITILGEIAVFSVPKIIYSQQNSRFNAIAKEDLSALAQAYQLLNLNTKVTSSNSAKDLTPYFNYVSYDTSSSLDDVYGYAGTISCDGSNPCLRLHNGSAIKFNACTFSGTTPNTNVVEVYIDPDGRVTSGGTATSDGKSVRGYIYYSGRIATWGTIANGATSSCLTWSTYQDPPYLTF